MKADKQKFNQAVAIGILLACSGSAMVKSQAAMDAAPAKEPAAASVITLDEAIRRAQASQQEYVAAAADAHIASLDRAMAKTALLPSVQIHNQGTYTQSNQAKGTVTTPIFIANNAVREYVSQGEVNESIGLGRVAEVQRTSAAAAKAAALQEIARRGLVVAVTGLFYGELAAEKRQSIADVAHNEAAEFLKLTEQREEAREGAHADVLKAQLQERQRTRELEDARLVAERTHLELGVLLFTDPRTAYTLAAPEAAVELPGRSEAQEAAARKNPVLDSALAALRESNAKVMAAWGNYLPSIGLNYTYGIDAPQFATNTPDHLRNLGYSASVSVDLPLWDWLAAQRKVKQSKIEQSVARVSLTAVQRQLIARFDETYGEAETAGNQLASLDADVKTAAESLRLTKLRYAAGEGTVLEVVDAQSSFVSVQNSREDGMVRYQTALATLRTLTGTL